MLLVTKEQLKQIMPNALDASIEHFSQPINDAMSLMRINTPQRMAAFLAQIAHESQQLGKVVESTYYTHAQRLFEVFPNEFASKAEAENYVRSSEKCANKIYANRFGNGNELSGDGWKYRGRGLIGITFKENYEKCGKAIGNIDLINKPELLEAPVYASLSAAWFFNSHSCNDLADAGMFGAITKKICPGMAGVKERILFYSRAKKTLACY